MSNHFLILDMNRKLQRKRFNFWAYLNLVSCWIALSFWMYVGFFLIGLKIGLKTGLKTAASWSTWVAAAKAFPLEVQIALIMVSAIWLGLFVASAQPLIDSVKQKFHNYFNPIEKPSQTFFERFKQTLGMSGLKPILNQDYMLEDFDVCDYNNSADTRNQLLTYHYIHCRPATTIDLNRNEVVRGLYFSDIAFACKVQQGKVYEQHQPGISLYTDNFSFKRGTTKQKLLDYCQDIANDKSRRHKIYYKFDNFESSTLSPDIEDIRKALTKQP